MIERKYSSFFAHNVLWLAFSKTFLIFIMIKSIVFEYKFSFALSNMYIFRSFVWVKYFPRGVWAKYFLGDVWARYMAAIQNFLCNEFPKKKLTDKFFNSNSYLSVRIFQRIVAFGSKHLEMGFWFFMPKAIKFTRLKYFYFFNLVNLMKINIVFLTYKSYIRLKLTCAAS